MVKHTKPTQEELDENIKKATEELDKPVVEEKVPEETPIDLPPDKPVPSKPDEGLEEEPAPSNPVVEEVEEKEPDYKKKFVESSRESIVQHAKNKKLTEAIDQASQIEEPTDEEMVKEFLDWDVMNDIEKRLAKDTIVNKRKFEVIHKASLEGKDLIEWNEKVDKFVKDPKTLVDNPDLEGKAEDFQIFASKPTRRGVDFNDLVSAFLFEISKAIKPNKGKLFESGSGGPNEKNKPPSDKISLAEARVLMKTDYKLYKEKLVAGKIDTSTLE